MDNFQCKRAVNLAGVVIDSQWLQGKRETLNKIREKNIENDISGKTKVSVESIVVGILKFEKFSKLNTIPQEQRARIKK